MATARDARDWARSTLRGIGNSLYTPFCGTDGDDIDWDAYRTLVRYCVGELKHPMLWCTSGIAAFWSLTLAERKQLLEIAIEEGRRARIYSEIPAVCATKDGAFRPASSRLLHELAPNLTIWECDLTVYRAGWLRAGIVGPAQLGTAGYLYETPQQPVISEYWELVWNDKLIEAMDYAEKSGLDQFGIDMASWFTCYPGRPDYFTHWGGAFKYAASVLGLPIGDYPHSRPPQAEFPAEGKAQIDAAYRRFGLVSV